MTETASNITSSGHIKKIGRDEGELFNVAGARFIWKVKNADTGYSLGMYEMSLEPGHGVPLHRHPYSEVFYILAGEVDFLRSDEWFVASPGETVAVPINCPHAFFNRTQHPAQLLSVSNQLHQGFFDAVAEADQIAPFSRMTLDEAMIRVAEIGQAHEVHFMPFEPPALRAF